MSPMVPVHWESSSLKGLGASTISNQGCHVEKSESAFVLLLVHETSLLRRIVSCRDNTSALMHSASVISAYKGLLASFKTSRSRKLNTQEYIISARCWSIHDWCDVSTRTPDHTIRLCMYASEQALGTAFSSCAVRHATEVLDYFVGIMTADLCCTSAFMPVAVRFSSSFGRMACSHCACWFNHTITHAIDA